MPLLALTSLTVRQLLRRRGVVFAIVFACVLLLVGNAVAIDSAARLRMLVQAVASLTLTFTVVAAVFSAAGLVPADLKDKTVYITLTKPVTRAGYLAGRLAGAAAVAAILATLFSVISIAYVGVRALTAPAAARSAIAAYNVTPVQSIDFRLVPEGLPVDIPLKNGRHHIDAELGIRSVVRFDTPQDLWVRTAEDGSRYITLRITARIEGAQTHYPVRIAFGETFVTVRLASRTPALVDLPIDGPPPSQVEVALEPGMPAMALGLDPKHIQLLRRSGSMTINLFKGVLTNVAAAVTVAAVAVMLSAVAGFAVASLTTLAVVLVGAFSSGISSLMQVYGPTGAPTYDSFFDTVLARIGWALVPLVEGLRLLIPDFSRYNLAAFYDQSLNVPAAVVAGLLLRAAVAVAMATLVGAFLFSRREPAANA